MATWLRRRLCRHRAVSVPHPSALYDDEVTVLPMGFCGRCGARCTVYVEPDAQRWRWTGVRHMAPWERENAGL